MNTLWTPEQVQLLKDNYHKVSSEKLVKLIGRPYSAIKIKASKLGIAKPGNPNPRKGKIAKNNTPDGTKKIFKGNKGSFWHIKIEGKWLRLHRYQWEQQNGKIPKGYRLRCVDGDTLNASPDNWVLVSNIEWFETAKSLYTDKRAFLSGISRRTRPKKVNEIVHLKVNTKTIVQVAAHKINTTQKRKALVEKYSR